MTRRQARQHSEMALAIRELLLANGEATQGLARRLGVGVTDALALDHLLSSVDGLGPTELAQRLSIRSASATTLVDRLDAAGHARRIPHGSDRRRQTIVATDKAYREVIGALSPLFAGVEQAAARLTPEHAAATVAFLHEVAAVLRAYAGDQAATGHDAGRPGPPPPGALKPGPLTR